MSLEDKYIILDMVKINQLQNGLFFAGKMKFKDLNQIYKLTERKELTLDPIYNTPAITTENEEDVEFQRCLNETKLRDIQAYLSEEVGQIDKKKSLGMFPSSLILYNRAYEPDDLSDSVTNADEYVLTEEVIQRSYRENLDCCFFIPASSQQKDIYKLYIPRTKKITLIVDGQHRFVGTQRYKDSLKNTEKEQAVDNLEFIITYLVGFDIYEVGQIFASVNFNQKPVNRSLYYDIFGSAPQTDRNGNLQNDIRLAHDLALYLNNNQTSPIKGMIKLLGKGYGLFSQAFFVDKMIRYVFKSKIWDKYLIDYLNGGKEYKIIAVFMKAFFEALKEAYNASWPIASTRPEGNVYSSYEYKHILCKTTGLGAFFRLIKNIYPLVESKPEHFKKNITNIFNKISADEARQIFSKDGDFGGAGSEGLQDKLYRLLLTKYNLDS